MARGGDRYGFSELAAALAWLPWDYIVIADASWAYVDESGEHYPNGHQHRGKYRRITLAGCVAEHEQWREFEHKLSQVLREPPGPVSMVHRAELFQANSKLYKGWSTAERRGLLLRFMNLLLKMPRTYFFGASIEVDDPQKQINEFYLRRVKDAVYRGIQQAGTSKVNFVFAKNKDVDNGSLLQVMTFLKRMFPQVGTYSFDGDPRHILPLQVADFGAYEIAHYIRGNQSEYFKRLKSSHHSVWVPEIDVKNVRTMPTGRPRA